MRLGEVALGDQGSVQRGVGGDDARLEAERSRDVHHSAGGPGDAQAVDHGDVLRRQRSHVMDHTRLVPRLAVRGPGDVHDVEVASVHRQAEDDGGAHVAEDSRWTHDRLHGSATQQVAPGVVEGLPHRGLGVGPAADPHPDAAPQHPPQVAVVVAGAQQVGAQGDAAAGGEGVGPTVHAAESGRSRHSGDLSVHRAPSGRSGLGRATARSGVLHRTPLKRALLVAR
jgi:hypothetical protein